MGIVERLREHNEPPFDYIAHEAAAEIEQLRKEIIGLREALELVVVYWDEWMDDPDSDPTALSLEEVVSIARATLGGRD